MPRLSNAKHELFAQYLAAGYSQADAYEKAGYTRSNTNASTLNKSAEVVARVQELIEAKVNSGEEKRAKRRENAKTATTAEEIGLTRIWVLTELMNMYEATYADQDYKSALETLRQLGREIGMFSGEAKPDPDANKRDTQATSAALASVSNALFGGSSQEAPQKAPEAPTATPEAPTASPDPTPAPAPPKPATAGLDALLDAFQTATD